MFLTLGDRIRNAREKLRLTQDELAEMAGIHRVMIGKYENDAGKPSIDVLVKVAKALGVSTDHLLGLDDTIIALNTDKEKPLTPEQRKGIEEASSEALLRSPDFEVAVDRVLMERLKKLFGGAEQGGIDE